MLYLFYVGTMSRWLWSLVICDGKFSSSMPHHYWYIVLRLEPMFNVEAVPRRALIRGITGMGRPHAYSPGIFPTEFNRCHIYLWRFFCRVMDYDCSLFYYPLVIILIALHRYLCFYYHLSVWNSIIFLTPRYWRKKLNNLSCDVSS